MRGEKREYLAACVQGQAGQQAQRARASQPAPRTTSSLQPPRSRRVRPTIVATSSRCVAQRKLFSAASPEARRIASSSASEGAGTAPGA